MKEKTLNEYINEPYVFDSPCKKFDSTLTRKEYRKNKRKQKGKRKYGF